MTALCMVPNMAQCLILTALFFEIHNQNRFHNYAKRFLDIRGIKDQSMVYMLF